MRHGDRIVISGAGPAGASLAIRLRRTGLHPVLLDAREFPRPKLCGGLVTEKTRRLALDILGAARYESCVVARSSRVVVRRNGSVFARFDAQLPFDFIDRARYDAAFVDTFLELGGEFRPGTRLRDPDTARRVARTNRGDIRFDVLVGADGANSAIRRSLEPAYRPGGFCLEYSSPGMPSESPPGATGEIDPGRRIDGNAILIDFFDGLDGYSWSFPNGPHRLVGTGTIWTGGNRKTLRSADVRGLGRWLEPYGSPPARPAGAFIPSGLRVRWRFGREPGVYLAGDAAGLANPVTGEGLYLASLSGLWLADFLAGRSSPDEHERRMRDVVRKLRGYGMLAGLLRRPGLWKRIGGNPVVEGRGRGVCDRLVHEDGDPLEWIAGRLGHSVKQCRNDGAGSARDTAGPAASRAPGLRD